MIENEANPSAGTGSEAPTRHPGLRAWVARTAALTTPDRIVWIDGSAEQHQTLIDELVAAGTFVKLKQKPDSYWCASDPTDVARVEDQIGRAHV